MPWAIREVAAVVFLRADDRSATSARKKRQRERRVGYSPAHGSSKRVLVAPRLAFLLMRRRIAAVKDALRRLLFEIPSRKWSQFRRFLGEEEATFSDFVFAIGFLFKATLYPLAAFLVAIATLLGALAGAGLL